MSEATFTIVYDGPALADHTMDVRDLAPAMLALGQLFDAANSALNGESAQIRVQVKATELGCFQITFEVLQTLGAQLVSFLSGPTVTAAANLVQLVAGGASALGLIGLIKNLKGRKIDAVVKLDYNTVRITIDTQNVDIPIALLRLYQDLAVRTATQKIVEEPLKNEGIASVEVKRGTQTVVQISKGERGFFAKPQIPDAILFDDVRRSAFSIISLAFKEDNKWRLNDGTNAISATIEDSDFLDKVDANQVSFSKGDILICDVRVVQKQTDSGLRTEYTVIRVAEHRPGARQLPLPLGIKEGGKSTPSAEPPKPPALPLDQSVPKDDR